MGMWPPYLFKNGQNIFVMKAPNLAHTHTHTHTGLRFMKLVIHSYFGCDCHLDFKNGQHPHTIIIGLGTGVATL